MEIQDRGVDENKIGVKLTKEAASEAELNSIYLTQLLHDVDRSLVLTLTIVRSATRRTIIRSRFVAGSKIRDPFPNVFRHSRAKWHQLFAYICICSPVSGSILKHFDVTSFHFSFFVTNAWYA